MDPTGRRGACRSPSPSPHHCRPRLSRRHARPRPRRAALQLRWPTLARRRWPDLVAGVVNAPSLLLPRISTPPSLSPEARGGTPAGGASERAALMALLPHPHAGGSHPEGPRPGHHRALTIRVTVSDVWRPACVLPDPTTPVVVRATASTAHRVGPLLFPAVLGATAPCP